MSSGRSWGTNENRVIYFTVNRPEKIILSRTISTNKLPPLEAVDHPDKLITRKKKSWTRKNFPAQRVH